MRTLEDIVPPSKRTSPSPAEPPPQAPPPYRRRSRFPFGTALIVLLVIAVCVGALYYFSSAEVRVTPNSETAAVSGSFTANTGSGDLPFEVVTAQKVATQSVQSS